MPGSMGTRKAYLQRWLVIREQSVREVRIFLAKHFTGADVTVNPITSLKG